MHPHPGSLLNESTKKTGLESIARSSNDVMGPTSWSLQKPSWQLSEAFMATHPRWLWNPGVSHAPVTASHWMIVFSRDSFTCRLAEGGAGVPVGECQLFSPSTDWFKRKMCRKPLVFVLLKISMKNNSGSPSFVGNVRNTFRLTIY